MVESAFEFITPFDANLHGMLRQTHIISAYCLVGVIAAHVSAVLLHTVTLRDGMLNRMGKDLARNGIRPTQGEARHSGQPTDRYSMPKRIHNARSGSVDLDSRTWAS